MGRSHMFKKCFVVSIKQHLAYSAVDECFVVIFVVVVVVKRLGLLLAAVVLFFKL